MAWSPPGTNHQYQAVFTLIERQSVWLRERDRSLAKLKFGRRVCGRVCVSVCVCLCDLFLSLHFVPASLPKQKFHGWGLQRWFWVQSWFLFVSDISALGHVCACGYMNHMFSHPADVSKKFCCCVFIPVRRWTSVWTSVIHFMDKLDSHFSGYLRATTFILWWWLSPDIIPGFVNNSGWWRDRLQ